MSPNAALALDPYVTTPTMPAPLVTIHSELLGTITVAEQAVLTFPRGLFGFPECRRFALVPAEREGLFWLQSAEYAPLAFLLLDPFPHFPDYGVELSAAERQELGAQGTADVAILCILTLPQTRSELPTANLQGPLALNLRAGLGEQIAVQDATFGTRCPVELGR